MSCFLLFVTLKKTFRIAKIERKVRLWARVVDIVALSRADCGCWHTCRAYLMPPPAAAFAMMRQKRQIFGLTPCLRGKSPPSCILECCRLGRVSSAPHIMAYVAGFDVEREHAHAPCSL